MAISENYSRQAALLVRDMPRLSVAIDLTYLPVANRAISLADIVGNMPHEHRRFLLSCKKCKPEWELLGIPNAEQLPAVKWRLQNLAKTDAKKREKLTGNLLMALGIES